MTSHSDRHSQRIANTRTQELRLDCDCRFSEQGSHEARDKRRESIQGRSASHPTHLARDRGTERQARGAGTREFIHQSSKDERQTEERKERKSEHKRRRIARTPVAGGSVSAAALAPSHAGSSSSSRRAAGEQREIAFTLSSRDLKTRSRCERSTRTVLSSLAITRTLCLESLAREECERSRRLLQLASACELRACMCEKQTCVRSRYPRLDARRTGKAATDSRAAASLAGQRKARCGKEKARPDTQSG